MRRSLSGLVGLLLVAAVLIDAPASAESPHASDVFAFGPFTAVRNTTFDLNCHADDVDKLFEGYRAKYPGGSGWRMDMSGRTFNGLRVRGGDERATLWPSSDVEYEGTGSFSRRVTVKAGFTARLTVAGWGGSLDCSLIERVGGADFMRSQPDSFAASLEDDGFDFSAAGANVFGIGSVAGGVYEHEAEGFIWYFSTTLAGSVAALGPEGQVDAAGGAYFGAWMTGAEPSNGTWQFSIPASVDHNTLIVTNDG